jgi:hypothetical protein
MATRMQQRRGTAATWTSANPILAAGEIGFEIDTNKFKIGDGSSRWDTLTYFTADAAAAIQDLIDGAPGVLDTLNELAAAVNDDPNFFATVATNLSNHEADTTDVHGIADTALLATKAYADQAEADAISTASADATSKANAAQAAAEATASAALASAVSDLEDDLNLKAPLASPDLTGIPTAPTAVLGTNTTQVATTAFVDAAIEALADRNLVLDGGGV